MKPEQFKKARKALKMSQVSMAAELGVTERWIRRRERGEQPAPLWLQYAVIGLLVGAAVRNKMRAKFFV